MEKILSDLKAMRLPGMAQTWQNLMEAHKINSISMADGIRMLIQGETTCVCPTVRTGSSRMPTSVIQ